MPLSLLAPPNLQGLRGELRYAEPMAQHVTWRAGGTVQLAYFPADLEDLAQLVAGLEPTLEILPVGLGSNLLVRDGGYRGGAIFTYPGLAKLSLAGEQLVYAEAGVPAAKLARFALRHGLCGAEFLAGIPGTLGGALAMNAGCYGGETWDLVQAVLLLRRDGSLNWLERSAFRSSYRQIALQNPGEDAQLWFVAAKLCLTRGDAPAARLRISQLLQQRRLSQPLQLPNAGSVFRNPPGEYAARLIEAAGLKGRHCGAARVSEKHANFIVNPQGKASADEIETLIWEVQAEVEARFGVLLQPEVRIVGEKPSE